MKKTTVCVYGAILGLFLNAPLFTQNVTKVGTTAASFLNIEVGAKAASMGNAFVAVANDATVMFWNPSGMARFTQNDAFFSHARWIADISFDYAAVVLPLGTLGTFGANATLLTMGAMDRTTLAQPDGTGETFDAGSYAFGIGYAKNLTDRFAIGFNVKYITEMIYHSAARGIAIDIGTLYTTSFKNLTLGMSISNFGTKMRIGGRDLLVQHDIDPLVSGNNQNINAALQTDSYDLPLLFRFGMSMDVLKGWGNSNFIIAIDALHPNDDTECINVGGEYAFNKMVFLRAGYKSLFARDAETGLTIGGGLKYILVGGICFTLDYAFEDIGILNEIHIFALGIKF